MTVPRAHYYFRSPNMIDATHINCFLMTTSMNDDGSDLKVLSTTLRIDSPFQGRSATANSCQDSHYKRLLRKSTSLRRPWASPSSNRTPAPLRSTIFAALSTTSPLSYLVRHLQVPASYSAVHEHFLGLSPLTLRIDPFG